MDAAHRCGQRIRDLDAVKTLAACFVMASLLLAACGGQTLAGSKRMAAATATPSSKLYYRGDGPGSWYPYAQVTFTRSTSYATALRIVTDLGLQPASPCSGTDGGPNTRWQANGLGQSDIYAEDIREGLAPILWVFVASRSVYDYDVTLYYAAPSDWPVRLSQQNAVTLVDDRTKGCTAGPSGDLTPIPGQVYFLDPAQPPMYIRVSFAAGTSYDQAMAAVSALGFRLADPCYEQAQPRPTWHPMGQETAFAASSGLTVATTGANAITWKQQLASTNGVTGLIVPYQPTC